MLAPSYAALERFEAAGFDRESKVIQLRFFGGLTNGEVAEHLGLGESTVRQAWAFAKTWLYRDLARTRAR